MNKGHKRKLVLIIISAAILVFYARTIPQVSLNERAIVVGLGIDYEDGKYSVVAQIINPSTASQSGSGNNGYGVLMGSGQTLTEAIVEISHKTGLKVSLSQCNVLVLGNGLPYGSEFPSVNFLVQNYQIPEQAVMVATDKKAADLLRSTPVLTSLSAFQMQQTFDSTEDSADVLHINIKNFVAGYVSKSGVVGVTYVVASEVEADNAGGDETGSSQAQKIYEFNYDKTKLYSSVRAPFLLEKEDTVSINLFARSLKHGSLEVELDGTRFSLQLTKSSFKEKCKLDNGRLKFNGKLKVGFNIAEVSDMTNFNTLIDVSGEKLSEIGAKVKQIIESQMMNTYNKCRDNGYDVFLLYNKAYSAEGVKWKDLAGAGDYFSLIDFGVSAEVTVSRK